MEEPKLTQEGRDVEWALHRDWGGFQAVKVRLGE